MSRVWLIVVAISAGAAGWALGNHAGQAERQEILKSLPEEREFWLLQAEMLENPTEQDLLCQAIVDMVLDYETDLMRSAAEEVDEINGSLSR